MEANRYLACDHKTAFGTGRRQDAGGIRLMEGAIHIHTSVWVRSVGNP